MPGPLSISPRIEISEGELIWRFSRSGGPGGQSVNTSSTRVELSFDLQNSPAFPQFLRDRALANLHARLVDGVLTVIASEHRSQYQNRVAAERRLIETLSAAIVPPARKRRPTRPTKASIQDRLDEKRRRGQVKRSRRSTED